jgi:hypothetical protein
VLRAFIQQERKHMKRFFCTLAIGIAAWALPGVGTVYGADMQSKAIAVPFAFKVDRTTLPAGRYRVEQNIGKHVIFLVKTETGHRPQIMRLTVTGPGPTTTLTFERTEGGYKLARIS